MSSVFLLIYEKIAIFCKKSSEDILLKQKVRQYAIKLCHSTVRVSTLSQCILPTAVRKAAGNFRKIEYQGSPFGILSLLFQNIR